MVGRFMNFILLPIGKGYRANIKPFKHSHVAYKNNRIEMLITNLKTIFINIVPVLNKISKTAVLVKTVYFGRLFENHFRLNQFFFQNGFQICSQHFSAVILICNMLLFEGISIFGFIRGRAHFITTHAPIVFGLKNLFQISQGFILSQ